ncbi:acetyl-CoA carboxylase biotin carboxylase subunit [Dactylosporangium fulvum]|uniref:biotin carboxylase n=1 Tax=Dactylosporangium fulvum TaxID=53359 RepID=A0ABY5W7U4_9ACTN|nr:acetyl-CoA carboxylase biotin carboxylase subunit [Dactylosporangium fulvum]UWP86110.1 acetyl-CoA carboxylase biotin carboxylase subunit [Dactylosporangium fulvum]
MPSAERVFDKVLVANRGEIALRVIRTCREMGIQSVAVYSTADRDAPFVRAADEAVQIGPGASQRSYLSAAAVVEAALRTGAQAVHPGYGFLSEDADFAQICADNGLVFIGPPPAVLARLADKAEARALMAKAGLPVLPGSERAVLGAVEVQEVASRMGYPLIIKAAAGGGGRGMSVVRTPQELLPVYRSTSAAARKIFRDGSVYLERFCEQARHVEVQVLADGHGTVLHLGERDCSVQRRRQKLIEECPAPGIPRGLVARMTAAAVQGAQAVGYAGAGTFEFLVHDDTFHFMEINCRIQVEHPVTEAVTGIDLVREQIRVAAGLPLSVEQSQVQPRGVAIECRVNAEDPARDFAPAPGLIDVFEPPGGPFVRVDSQARPAWRIPSEYDSLLAKVIAWAPDRNQAIARMDRALAEFRIAGPAVHTTRSLLRAVLRDEDFIAAAHHTGFLDEHKVRRLVADAPAD